MLSYRLVLRDPRQHHNHQAGPEESATMVWIEEEIKEEIKEEIGNIVY